ncbi:phosphoadenosine phosphosulfate reductase [Erythrobacter phage vB_EliS_R6L]|nr:phosphoadenosine phosphosulfate reductase [Erythrobacter phage vB_EliS_R6L]
MPLAVVTSRPAIPGLDFPIPRRPDGSIIWPAPDPSSPYWLTAPALISFSGGRTSAFMLFQHLWAHGGTLPDGVWVTFANTGKEREETLRFVHECESRWGVRVWWLEWVPRPEGQAGRKTPWADRFEIVGLNSASRDGEPLLALFERKKFLPNAVTRFCTADAKIDTMKAFMLSHGYERWTNVIGLRSDEMRRIAKQAKRNEEGKERFETTWPMLRAKVTKRDIWRFWLGGNIDPKNLTEPLPQGFDLGLWPYEGNCDGCFLKGRDVLMHQERERPGYLDWWIAAERWAVGISEKPDGERFAMDFSYADLKRDVARQPLLIPIDPMHLEAEGECGVGGTDTEIRCGAR